MMLERIYADFAWEQAAALLAIDSPTGYTRRAAEWVKEAFEKLGFPAHITTKGGVIADLGIMSSPSIIMKLYTKAKVPLCCIYSKATYAWWEQFTIFYFCILLYTSFFTFKNL